MSSQFLNRRIYELFPVNDFSYLSVQYEQHSITKRNGPYRSDVGDIQRLASEMFTHKEHSFYISSTNHVQGVGKGDVMIAFENAHFIAIDGLDFQRVMISTSWRGPPASEEQCVLYLDFAKRYFDSLRKL